MLKNPPSISIVILNWNGRHFLEKYLPSVLETAYNNFQVVVADNNSTDDSVSFLEENYKQVEIIRLDKNYGFAGGYNRALEKIHSKYYVLLNSDVKVDSGWIQPVMDLMESDSSIAACQPKILSLNHLEQFEYAGASGGWIDKLGYPFCRGRVFDYCEKDSGQYNDATTVFWASGAAMFIRSDCYHSEGGLDEYLFAHQEEIDLCWRLQNKGFKIYVQPKSLVYHLGGGSLQAGSKMKVFLNFRNSLILLHKNLPRFKILQIILLRMMLDGLAGLRFLFQGQWAAFTAVIEAHFAYYRWILKHKKKSGMRQSLKQLQGVYRGSIVWAYFLKGKKTFSDIVKNKN